MKREVKVGKAFDGEISITVVVEREPPKKDEFSLKKAIAYVVIALILGVVFSSVAYGMATGDYSIVKGLAETFKDALDTAIKVAAKLGK